MIDNSLSLERIRRALSPKIVASVLLIMMIASIVLYITLENLASEDILIWYVTTESEDCFSGDSLRLVNEYASKKGIDKVVLTKRHPEDTYFDAAMSTSAYYNCDIFIMKADMAREYFELDMFLPLSVDGDDESELLFVDDNAIGRLIYEDYYLLINAKTDFDLEIIYDIFNIFTRTK